MKTAGSVQDILLETFPAAPVHFINNLFSSYIEGQLRHFSDRKFLLGICEQATAEYIFL